MAVRLFDTKGHNDVLNFPFEGIRLKDVCDILCLREDVCDISVVFFPLDEIIPAGMVNKGSESQKRTLKKPPKTDT